MCLVSNEIYYASKFKGEKSYQVNIASEIFTLLSNYSEGSWPTISL